MKICNTGERKYFKNPSQSARRKQNYHTQCGKNCHKILCVVLRLNEIRYCSIAAKSSLEILAYITAFLKIKREKNKNLQTKSVTTSPGLSYFLLFYVRLRLFFLDLFTWILSGSIPLRLKKYSWLRE